MASVARRALPPGPGAPAVWQLVRWIRDPIPFLLECRDRYGSCFTIRFPQMPPYILFSDPRAIQDIFVADPDVLRAGQTHAAALRPFLGNNSLLTLDGERHRRHRRLLAPPFHGERMHAYGEVIRDTASRDIRAWPVGRLIAMRAAMQRITLDVMLRCVFGHAREETIAAVRDSVVGLLGFVGNPRALAAGLALWLQRDLGPLTPWRRMLRAKREFEAALLAEMTRRRAAGAGGPDILSLLVAARDEADQPMTDEEILDELKTLLFGGHETTATALAWCTHYLLAEPAIMNRVVEELRHAIDRHGLDSLHAAAMPYLDATIKETLRLMPILPLVGRHVTQPVRVGDLDVPAGVNVMPCISLTHRNPAVWTDPDRFIPDRFLDAKPSPYAFLPFGGGSRRCIGMSFALHEMRIVLAEMLARVRLKPVAGYRATVVRRGLTLAPSGGVPVVVEAHAA